MTRRHTRAGVALLDVLIAALLLGIGLSVTLSMASQALRGRTNRRVEADCFLVG